ncbi:hypothetical protein Tco_1340859 [Tanacetum coccineum]
MGTPLMLDSYTFDMCMQSWGRSSYARVMIELRADVDLKDNIVVAMPKVIGEGHYTQGRNQDNPSQTSRGVPVGQKIGFKPQKEYIHVPKKTIAGSSGNKNKGVVPTIKVKNSNLFEVLNSIDNDVDTTTTPIIDKISKFEELLSSGKATLVDEAGNPLKKVEFPDDYDSEDEVASVDNDMARSLDSERVGFGTQSLLEQWRDSYSDGDYDEDPYDDDMYEGHDLTQEIQAICYNMDIQVRGRKKK